MKSFKAAAPFALLALPLLLLPALTGCVSHHLEASTVPRPAESAPIEGKLMGGEQPLQNAKIYLYSAGNINDQIAGYTPGYGSASNSLLTTNGGYVTTSATGGFSLTGLYTCPQQNSQVYLLSVGGDPGIGAGTDNQAAVLMAALGTCGNLSASTFITMNELTTVAAITALQQFIADPTHIGTSASNVQGLNNAFITAQQLVKITNGGVVADTALVKFPSAKIVTLANAMVGCVNGTGASAGTCPAYFAAAANPSTSVAPTTTFEAQLNIARFPRADPTGVINSTPPQTAFGPSLLTANDFSLAITYTGGGIAQTTAVAIDQAGNAFVTSCGRGCDNTSPYDDSIVEIQPYGGTGNLANGYIGSGAGFGIGSIHRPQGLAINQSSVLGVTNGDSTISGLYPDGTPLPNTPLSNPAIVTPEGIAWDNTGTAYVANAGNQTVVSVALGSTVGTPFTNPSLVVSTGVAFAFNQPVNNLIVTDSGGGQTPGGVVIFQSNGSGYDSGNYVRNGALHPGAVALDAGQNIWEVDSFVAADSAPKVYKLSSAGAAAYAASSGVALAGSGTIEGLAIDGSGNVLLPSCTTPNCAGTATDNLFFLDNTGAEISGRSGLQNAYLNNPVSVALDSSGNAWVASAGGATAGSITRFIGVASPVQTPIASAVSSQTTGTRP